MTPVGIVRRISAEMQACQIAIEVSDTVDNRRI